MTALIDETLPLDTDLAGNGAARIRETRAALNDLKDELNDLKDEYDGQLRIIGVSVIPLLKLIPISPTFPWFCLSYPSVNFTTANYPTEFIDELRSRKYIYGEFGSNVSAFSGSWSSNVFTLTDNAANKAMLAELAEDWLYHGSPTSNWRILRSNNQDYNITGITVATRKITVNIDGSATSGTSIEIFTNRVYRQATQARHFSEAGLATYQAGGGKSGRLFRRDQMQRITGNFVGCFNLESSAGVFSAQAYSVRHEGSRNYGSMISFDSSRSARTSAETDGETIAKSSSRYEYIYVGSYTA